MKVKEFFAVTKGSRQLVISGSNSSPMCGRDFWGRYRQTKIWDAEIEHVCLVSSKVVQDGIGFDGVICQISLREVQT